MYVPLYLKTNYSLLSSLLSIKTLVTTLKEHNFSYASICDDNMFGVMEFYKECKKNGIAPIIGLDVKIEDYNVCVFAKNYLGYKNLIKLSTIQSERKVEIEDLKKYKNDIYMILPCFYKSQYEVLKDITEDFYIGFSNREEEKEARKLTKNFVFFPKTLFLSHKEKKYLKYLIMIRDNKTIRDEYEEKEGYPLFIEDIYNYSSNEGIYNTNKIASTCNVIFPKSELMLPIYETKEKEDSFSYLYNLAKKGLEKRFQGKYEEKYLQRLNYELEIINRMGFSNYFLVVYDFIKYAKQNGILVGPGRGSAAGSLVSFCLGITDIDPIKYDLLFERFLNPERVTMPDIDTDFPDIYREEVIHYVKRKYGEKNVAGIVTFGTLGAKQAIRDVSRVLNIALEKVNAICKCLPTFSKLKLKDFYRENEEFRNLIESEEQIKKMFEIACFLEGFPRHTSIHAAGIVMCKCPLDEVLPLTKSEDLYLTGYPMEYLEELGLLKMDFLGLKNLTTIMNIIKEVKDTTKEEIVFSKIPLNDKEALKIFYTANTSGIFQFESTGMKNFLSRLKPTSLEDIFAAIALFRPGPSVNIDSYIRRKHKEEKITYLDPKMEEILKPTYGIIVYQEQIMQIARTLAGFSYGEADILRRAMSKKKYEVLKKEEERFINGCIKNGLEEKKAKEVYDLILNFANYGFNRAHSVAYSIIAYKMAYLKAHYKNAFFSNLLSSVIGSETKTLEYIYEAKANGITILKPNINKSKEHYLGLKEGILFPLSCIRNVGTVACKEIMKQREEGFLDIFDCFYKLRGLSRKCLESLIYASCFDCFSYNKKTLLSNLDTILNYVDLIKDLDPSLVEKPELKIEEEFSKEERMQFEKEVFGFYLSNHPVTKYKNKYNTLSLDCTAAYLNKDIQVIILVENIKEIETKTGLPMAFISGSDERVTMDFTLFPKVYQRYNDLKKGEVLLVVGRVERRYDKYQIIIKNIKKLEEKTE